MNMINVFSEINTLKKVLVHRPGKELENLTPKWLSELLFEDIPWLKKAQEEHDNFTSILKANDIIVVELIDLVTQTLKNDKIKHLFINEFLKESSIDHPKLKKRLFTYLDKLDLATMIQTTIIGIKKTDLELKENYRLKDYLNDYPFLTNPMPNLFFTRDPFASIFNGISISKMEKSIRQRETLYSRFIFKHHPEYKNTINYYSPDTNYSIEGGDILVLNENTLIVGISERTEPEAIEILATNLFKNQIITHVLAIDLPKKRSFMHLDTVLTQVDYDKFLVPGDFLRKMNCYEITYKNESLKIIARNWSLKKLFSTHLKKDVTMIPCGGKSKVASAREQWSDGANALAIKPGLVVVYERNVITNKLLEENGIKVISFQASEISRGRGGPRCMSMPLIRE